MTTARQTGGLETTVRELGGLRLPGTLVTTASPKAWRLYSQRARGPADYSQTARTLVTTREPGGLETTVRELGGLQTTATARGLRPASREIPWEKEALIFEVLRDFSRDAF